MQIAIDGNAASGKGTISKFLSEYFNLNYLDTGKVYRGFAKIIIDLNIDTSSKSEIINQVNKIKDISIFNEFNGIQTEKVGNIASIVSSIPEVRNVLDTLIKDFPKNSEKGVVMDGRNIGKDILPNADFKFFIIASPEKRAERRSKQSGESYNIVLQSITERDKRESERSIATLKPQDDSIIIDTSDLTIEEVKEVVLQKINNKLIKKV